MLISLKDLEHQPLEFSEHYAPGVIGLAEGIEQSRPLATQGRAELIEEHRGGKQIVRDIRVVGKLATEVAVACARCLERVEKPVNREFDLLYRPLGVDRRADEVSISEADTEIGYYAGDGLLLEDVLREQVLLELPMRAICREGCKGLCPQCGANLNVQECGCGPAERDARWVVLREWKKQS